MRAYPILLGLALTAAYGYAAQVAVTSVGARRAEAAAAPWGIRPGHAPVVVWYGGTLAPVTVEARGDSPAKTAVTRSRLLDRSGVGCAKPSHRYSAVL